MLNRRKFLAGTSAATVAGIAVGATGATVVNDQIKRDELAHAVGRAKVAAAGEHQSGIELDLQSHTRLIALDLSDNTDREAMMRWMNLLTDDILRLTEGRPVLADPQPELAVHPARLTVVVGFGPSVFKRFGLKMPEGFGPIPSFEIDQLLPEYSDGDVLLHLACDDLPMLAHAARSLIRDSEAFAAVRWVQDGFSNSQGVVAAGVRQRNMMGQVDGTINPELHTQDFADLVWINSGEPWAVGGTQLVVRRIKMTLDTWDKLSSEQKEKIIGRKLSNGAPLTGENETDIPDFAARDERGFTVIPDYAHIRNAGPGELHERFLRRPFNYVDSKTGEAGLIWMAYAANLSKQYLPVQTRLAKNDLLNKWTVPVGSAVFFIPRGFQLGETLAKEMFA